MPREIRPNMSVSCNGSSGLVGCVVTRGDKTYFTIAAHVCKAAGDTIIVGTSGSPGSFNATVIERKVERSVDTALVEVPGGVSAENSVVQTNPPVVLNKVWVQQKADEKLRGVTTNYYPNSYDGWLEGHDETGTYHGKGDSADSGGAVYCKDGTLVGFISASNAGAIHSTNIHVILAEYVFDHFWVNLKT